MRPVAHQCTSAVLVQGGAGLGSGFPDTEYRAAGARSVGVEEAWDAELVLAQGLNRMGAR
jgi:alanine dehydrogenase